MSQNQSGGKIKSIDTAFEIVERLVDLDGAGVSELADDLGMPNSTVHDHLRSLHDREYVIKENNRYHVSTRFLEIGEHARERRKIYRIARDEVDDLAATTDEHANMMIEEHGKGVFLYTAEGENAVQLDTHSGMRVPLQTTALGKCILASMPESEVNRILDRVGMPKVTEKTITDREALFDKLDEIRERGYAFDVEERVPGMNCVAAPVKCDDTIGAVSVSGPASRLTDERFTEEIPELVVRAANVIEVNMKYS